VLRPFGEAAPIDDIVSRRLWTAIRDAAPFAAGPGDGPPLWRISTAPSRGPALVARILAATAAEVLYDWGGGLIWVAVLGREDAAVRSVRAAVAATGGSAMLFRASEALRAVADVFDPQDASLAALTKRVKEGFDPRGVLNSGRMWAQV
jgi:glycolate oxidase FAD binding subunit